MAVSGTLKWSCSANDGGSTLSYDLYMGTSSSNMTLYKSGSGTSCAYSGLSAGKKYYWKLIAYNGSGKSTQGPVWSFTTKEGCALYTVVTVTVQRSNQRCCVGNTVMELLTQRRRHHAELRPVYGNVFQQHDAVQKRTGEVMRLFGTC